MLCEKKWLQKHVEDEELILLLTGKGINHSEWKRQWGLGMGTCFFLSYRGEAFLIIA